MPDIARHWRDWLSGGGYLMPLLIALHLNTAATWTATLAATLALALLAWYASLRRWRAVSGTPTSRVASAAQGYVELVGTGRAWPEVAVLSPTHHLPCLWYRYRLYVRQGDKWQRAETNESDTPFILDDGSGRCLLIPEGAEILSDRKETYRQGDEKIEEELLLPGDRLYALGEFGSRGGAHTRFDERAELGQVLAEWKADRPALLDRFDLDGDGDIDQQEWRLARQAAQREVDERRRQALSEPVGHVLGPPGHGRPHVIANFPPERLAGHYRWRAWLHGLAACASLIGLAIAAQSL